jgi:SAM-dependent methyltransferase
LECFRERRLPYRLRRTLTSPAAARALRPIIDALLRFGADREPRPITYDEAVRLHRQYPIRDGYKYDVASKKARAAERFIELDGLVDLCAVSTVAEVGGGDGQLAMRLFAGGITPVILDVRDWRDDDVRRAGVAFLPIGDSGTYGLADGSVDLVVSYNTLEHVHDPSEALREMVRVTRPGGHIYASFCPLYNSPFGLHAYRTFYAPYPQFLLSPEDLARFVAENGITDLGEHRTQFQYVNGWSAAAYRSAVAALRPAAECVLFRSTRDLDHLDIVYRYLPSFWGRSLSFDELTTSLMHFLLIKR